jgi:hypothetical protein
VFAALQWAGQVNEFLAVVAQGFAHQTAQESSNVVFIIQQ